MFRKINILFLFLSLVIGFAVLYLINPLIAIIYSVLWFDKVLIGVLPLHKFGIELTTVATIMLGIIFGPAMAFVFTIIVVPILYGLKYLLLPLPHPEWPLFIPSGYNFVEALGAAVAGLLAQQALLIIFAGVWIVKEITYVMVDKFMGKPPDIIYPIGNIVFNLIVVVYLGKFFLGLVGL